MANIKGFTITKKDGLKLDNWQQAMGEAIEKMGVQMFTELKTESHKKMPPRHRDVRDVSSKKMKRPKLSLDNVLTPEEIDDFVWDDMSERIEFTEQKKRRAREGIKNENQPQAAPIYYITINNYEKERTNMTSLDQLRCILGQNVTFNGNVSVNNGDGFTVTTANDIYNYGDKRQEEERSPNEGSGALAKDYIDFPGNSLLEQIENVNKIGNRLHERLKTMRPGQKGLSDIIVYVIKECVEDGLITVLPLADAFNRLFKQYFADNIIRIDPHTFNDKIKAHLRSYMTVDKAK